MNDFKEALEGSPFAGRIGLDTRVVIHEEEMDGTRLAELVREGTLEIPEMESTRCTLRAGGEILASGRIVRRRGGFYFKVEEVRR